MKCLFDVIRELESTPSRNDKLKILKDNVDNGLLKKVFEHTYEKNSGIKSLKTPYDVYQEVEPIHIEQDKKLDNFLDNYINLKPNSNELREYIYTYSKDNLTKDYYEILTRILKGDLLVGVTKTTYKKIWNDQKEDDRSELLLCNDATEDLIRKIGFPVFAQVKYDAARIYFSHNKNSDKTSAFSRGQNELKFPVDVFDEIKSLTRYFGDNTVYVDGEAFYKSTDSCRKLSNGVFNKLVHDTATDLERDSFIFVVWDMYVKGDTRPYKERYALLSQMFETFNYRKFILAENKELNNIQEIKSFVAPLVKRGLEGAIIKNPKSIWKSGKQNDALKIKVFFECELEIIDVIEGKNSRSGKLGAFKCKSSCGSLIVNVSGFDKQQLDEYYTPNMIGKIITVKANSIIQDLKKPDLYSLYLPSFIEVRHDKKQADSLDSIKSIYYSVIENQSFTL